MKKSARPEAPFLLAMLIFGTIGVIRSVINLPSGFVAAFRGLCGAFVMALFFAARGGFALPSGRDLPRMALSGFFLGMNWVMLFESYKLTSVAVATLCNYTEPVFLIVISVLFLHERITPRRIAAIAMIVFGMFLVTGAIGDGAEFSPAGTALGLLSAVFFAGLVLMNRAIREKNAMTRTFFQLLSAGLTALVYSLCTEKVNLAVADVGSLLFLLMLGVVQTGIVYMIYFGSMTRMSVQSVAFLSYSDPVFAVLLSACVLHQIPSLSCIAGIVIVMVSLIIAETDGAKPKPNIRGA